MEPVALQLQIFKGARTQITSALSSCSAAKEAEATLAIADVAAV